MANIHTKSFRGAMEQLYNGDALHVVSFYDSDIIEAYNAHVKIIKHPDMISEAELCVIHHTIKEKTKQDSCMDVSLIWLRNQLVRLRKGGHLKKASDV